MKKIVLFRNSCAVSQIIGGLLLVLIALLAFVPIYLYMFPIPMDSPDANTIKVDGYVNTEGIAILEHMGGESISEYRIDIRYVDNSTLIKSTSYDEAWSIGNRKYPLQSIGGSLLSEEDEFFIGVYAPKSDDSEKVIFEGILSGTGPDIYCTLTVIVIGNNGSVSPERGTYAVGTVVTLVASPDSGYRVKEWDGTDIDPFVGSNYNLVTMDTDKTVTVEFEEIPADARILNATVIGGNGTVFPPYGIFDNGTIVQLTATPDSGYLVKAWNQTDSDPSTGSNTNTVTMDEDKNVTVSFEIDSDLLISSLRTDTSDEDLICYNYAINPTITPLSHIYSWQINSQPFAKILLSFDTDIGSSTQVKDYSGNTNDATRYGPTWTSGKVGGGYSFDGIDDYMEIPYCFDSNYVDEVTIETWINTAESSETITSFERDKYWELSVSNGKAKWSTTSGSSTVDTTGTTQINDSSWHYVAATFDSATGENKIFIDGDLEKCESAHTPGNSLGTGDSPTGSIGKGTTVGLETLLSTSFETATEENAWSRDNDRSDDWAGNAIFERFGTETMSPNTDSYCIGGTGDLVYWFSRQHSAYSRDAIDISGYSSVKVSVWYSYKSTEGDDYFGFYYQDGSSWVPIFEDYDPNIGTDNQLSWTYAEAVIPDSIDSLVLQFYWSTSESREYFAIDDLQVTGLADAQGGNFSGTMDEFCIYEKTLSEEQIHQNYLCKKNGVSNKSIIVSDETAVGETWICNITPNDSNQDGIEVESNSILIKNYGGG